VLDAVLSAIVRTGRVIAPSADDTLETGDELIFVCAPEQEPGSATAIGRGMSLHHQCRAYWLAREHAPGLAAEPGR
jgi:K+ transport systems, NAD-binding component